MPFIFVFFQKNGNYFIKFRESDNNNPQRINMYVFGKEKIGFNVRIDIDI